MVLHFPFSTVRFPVILLFWSLSLSPVWLNIEGRQDFKYYTPILSFYSENNSESLNRSPNTNLIVVHWFHFFVNKTSCVEGHNDRNKVFWASANPHHIQIQVQGCYYKHDCCAP